MRTCTLIFQDKYLNFIVLVERTVRFQATVRRVRGKNLAKDSEQYV